MVLIGTGKLKNKIEMKAIEYGLNNSIYFLETRSDIPQLLCSMDCFVFPSFYEGMPNAVIEAQTSGLPCLVSDSVTKECAITKLVEFESLNNSPEVWSNHLLNMTTEKNRISRYESATDVKNSGYDIKNCAEKFVNIIFENNEKGI